MKSLGLPLCNIMSSENKNSFTSYFVLDAFTFSCLVTLAGTSSTVLNKSGESGHLCLVPNFRGKTFCVFPLSMMLTLGLSYMDFIVLRYFPSTAILLGGFCHGWILNSVRSFFACVHLFRWSWFLSFILLMLAYHIDW